jgi:flagellar motor switch protein FliN
MSDAVVYEQFEESAPPGPAGTATHAVSAAGGGAGADLRRLSDVPMELSVEIGRTQMTVGETLGLRPGSIITLERLAGEPVDLLVNGTPLARGEVVVVDEQFGLRVTEILDGERRAQIHEGASLGEMPSEGTGAGGPSGHEQTAEGRREEDSGEVDAGEGSVGGAPSAQAPPVGESAQG